MKITARLLTCLAAASTAFFSSAFADVIVRPPEKPARQPVVQLALLLDTSNSMDGLIDQARTRLWTVVNDLATARHSGIRPRLEVALYEYGNDGLSAEGNYIREVAAFTDDLDDLSQKLFALRTNGGSEFCGAVIARALDRLHWSNDTHDLKLVFIAGNEPFDQGPIDFRASVRAAAARGITINTIFCGPDAEGVATFWKDGAVLADGTYASIDQNQQVPHIDAPQDRELAELNDALNHTYLAYGAAGAMRAEMQAAQDANAAAAAPSVAAQRVAAKASVFYRNSSWDLVDAVNEGAVQLDQMRADELPEELRDLPADQRAARIQEMSAERKRVQDRIQQLASERDAYVTTELAKLAAASGDTATALNDAIRNSVRAQAAKLDYQFENTP